MRLDESNVIEKADSDTHIVILNRADAVFVLTFALPAFAVY